MSFYTRRNLREAAENSSLGMDEPVELSFGENGEVRLMPLFSNEDPEGSNARSADPNAPGQGAIPNAAAPLFGAPASPGANPEE